jgi:hypothetical protein
MRHIRIELGLLNKMKSIVENCVQCDELFEISVNEQERCERMGFDLPIRCPQCRKHKTRQVDDNTHRKSKDKKKHYRMKNDDYKRDYD